jgi:hypothetical protein
MGTLSQLLVPLWLILTQRFIPLHGQSVNPASKLWIPSMISSSMVLARVPLQTRIWGKAPADQSIKLIMDSTYVHWNVAYHSDDQTTYQPSVDPLITLDTVSSSSGDWSIDLPQQSASINWTITITASDQSSDPSMAKQTITLSDISFGDVFFCSGQSNMEMPLAYVKQSVKYLHEIVTDRYDPSIRPALDFDVSPSIKFSGIRLFSVEKAYSGIPLDDVRPEYHDGSRWSRVSLFHLTDGQVTHADSQSEEPSIDTSFYPIQDPYRALTRPFSALCYITGREIYLSLDGTVPIGLISSSVGMTLTIKHSLKQPDLSLCSVYLFRRLIVND